MNNKCQYCDVLKSRIKELETENEILKSNKRIGGRELAKKVCGEDAILPDELVYIPHPRPDSFNKDDNFVIEQLEKNFINTIEKDSDYIKSLIEPKTKEQRKGVK